MNIPRQIVRSAVFGLALAASAMLLHAQDKPQDKKNQDNRRKSENAPPQQHPAPQQPHSAPAVPHNAPPVPHTPPPAEQNVPRTQRHDGATPAQVSTRPPPPSRCSIPTRRRRRTLGPPGSHRRRTSRSPTTCRFTAALRSPLQARNRAGPSATSLPSPAVPSATTRRPAASSLPADRPRWAPGLAVPLPGLSPLLPAT